MDLKLRDRLILISGGARGIGAATARAFAAEGCRVALIDRDGARGRELAATLPGAVAIEAELTSPESCARAVSHAADQFGRIDVVINNAGGNDKVGLTASPVDFMRSVERNLIHVFALVHEALPFLVKASGAIVNVSSKVALTGQGHTSGYAAAKGAVNALTREWAAGLAADGVRVNTVVPAECDTEQYRSWFEAQPDPALARQRVANLIPLGRRLTLPEEVADTIVWLASPRSSHTTGQIVFVDGGYTHLDRALGSNHSW